VVRGYHSFGSRRKESLHFQSPIREIPRHQKVGPQFIVGGHIRENSKGGVRDPLSLLGFGDCRVRGLTYGIAKSRNLKYPFG
jgi:hypothetical protein